MDVRPCRFVLRSVSVSDRYHNVGNLRFSRDQTLIVHPVDILLPAGLGLRQELCICSLHERKQRFTGLLLYIRVQRKVRLILIVEQNLQNLVRAVLEVLEALAACGQKASKHIRLVIDHLIACKENALIVFRHTEIIREEVRKVLEGQDVSKINREMPTEVDLMEEEPLRMDQTMRQNVVDAISAFRRA